MIAERNSSVRARRGSSTRITEAQRMRMLGAAALVLDEVGYEGMSVARITSRANVSRRTFYDQFEDREDCFLALFDEALGRASQVAGNASAAVAAPAGKSGGWRERVRAALYALLVLIDDEPALGSLLIVEALSGGPKVLKRRALALQTVKEAVDQGRTHARAGSSSSNSRSSSGPPPLTAEGVVGAVFSVIHARLLEHTTRSSANGSPPRRRSVPEPLTTLLNPLMGMIVLPYLGQAAAAKELARPAPKGRRASMRSPLPRKSSTDPLQGLQMRLTYRTLLVLSAIAEHPGASNRRIADVAEVHDQGQMSKLLGRLGRLGLIVNAGAGQPKGEPNAWKLTSKGQKVQTALSS
jgi:AcrR family transcriptional regulator